MRFFRAFRFSSIIFAKSMANNFIFLFSDNSKRSKNQLLLIFILYEHRWSELRKLMMEFWLTLVS